MLNYSEHDVLTQVNQLLRGTAAGRFRELEPPGGTSSELIHTSRAAVFGDVDNDGGVDVLVMHRDAPTYLLRNVVPNRGHWLRFSVIDDHGRNALGAVVSLTIGDRRITRQVQSAYSYCAANDPRVQVGTGAATSVSDVSVRWIDGAEQSFGRFSADRTVELRQSTSAADRR